MRTGMVTVAMAAALLAGREAAAQMYKCTDAAGKITYSSEACKTLGLKDAGEVKDRIQVTPAFRPPPAPPRKPAAAELQQPPLAKEPATPERRCFTTKSPTGATVTRCNDKPED